MSTNYYEMAQRKISAGKWSVDPEAGHVLGRRGQRIGNLMEAGYERLTVGVGGYTKHPYSHRVIWEYVHGPIPEGLQINHINGVKNDNRIENIELATSAENIAHAIRTGLRSGVPESLIRRNTRVSDANVLEIRRRRKDEKVKLRVLAEEYGISQAQVSRIANDKTRLTAA